MVKDHVLSNCGKCNRARIPIFTYMVHYISKNIVTKFYALVTNSFLFTRQVLFPALFAPSLISCFYACAVVCTSQNGRDKAKCIVTRGAESKEVGLHWALHVDLDSGKILMKEAVAQF